MSSWTSSTRLARRPTSPSTLAPVLDRKQRNGWNYLTTAQPTTLAKERATNGHPAPYKIAFLGIGNESWDCGGNMTPDYYLSQLKTYSRFVRNFNPAQQDNQQVLKIAVCK